MSLIEQLKHARRVSVPLVAVQTPDPEATMRMIASADLNGKPSPAVAWDIVRGTWPVNEAGRQVAAITDSGEDDVTIQQPVAYLELAVKFPARTIAFVCNAHEYMDDPAYRQGIWNLRDQFKQNRRMLILLAPSLELPPSLKDDVVILDEALPDAETLTQIVGEQDEAANDCMTCGGDGRITCRACKKEVKPTCRLCGGEGTLKCEDCHGSGKSKRKSADKEMVGRAVAATQGLSAFAAEQAVAMSLRPDGIDLDHLWESKRRQIEQTPGLSVWRGGETFADVCGLNHVKDFLSRIIKGKRRPSAVVYVEEINRMVAGSEGQVADSSGVSQGILQALLTHMEDHDAKGLILLGPPGTGKTLLGKATGGEAGVPTVEWDSNAMKNSLVGASEANTRTALKVISAVSGDRALWLASCNSVRGIPTALRRRFGYGCYMVDLPDAKERHALWMHYLVAFGHMKRHSSKIGQSLPPDANWTGAEVRTCCELASDLDCTLKEAAGYIVPVAQAMPDEIEDLRKEADGKYMSASRPSVYRRERRGDEGRGREISV